MILKFWVDGLNSTMVRLKRIQTIKPIKLSNGLNSTMVRLKPFQVRVNKTRTDQSQFHYGSIKTFLKCLKANSKKSSSQFHYGSIKTENSSKIVNFAITVSIPLWFD